MTKPAAYTLPMDQLLIVGTTGDLFSRDLDLRSKVFLKVIFGNIGLEWQ